MDFLDPKKLHAHKVRLMIGYVLISMAILLGTILLLYLAYGFGVNNQGKIIQNGLVFVSSQPGGSSLYLNNRPEGATSSRLALPAGQYTLDIKRTGYRTWHRVITVDGGSVEHFDYPFLFPAHLVTKDLKAYSTTPSLALQSLDRHWLLIERPGALGTFDQFDLSNPKTVATTTPVTLPSGVLTPAKGPQALSLVQWSNDNRHVLLKHTFDKTYEYILLDRQNPARSINLSKALGVTAPDVVTLQNEQYDHYFVYDPKTTVLGTASLSATTVAPLVQYVADYKTYGNDIVLYATNHGAPANETRIMLYQNGTTYFIRTVPRDTKYLLDLTQYNGSWFVAAGAPKEGKIYVYQDPVTVLQKHSNTVLVPVDVLKVKDPNYLAFSTSAQYIMAENANNFAVYDTRYDKDYTYTIDAPFDAAQKQASWMDGARLTYISKGKLVVFDYDSANEQILQPASADYIPFFDRNYKYVYSIAPSLAGAKSLVLTRTALLTPADQ